MTEPDAHSDRGNGMKRKTAYDKAFGDPLRFTDGSYWVHGDYSRADAAQRIAEVVQDKHGNPSIEAISEKLHRGRVRFGFVPADCVGADLLPKCAWVDRRGRFYKRGDRETWVYYDR